MLVALAVVFAATSAPADWIQGDPYKMHFPQLPDPQGWDIEIASFQHEVADDWMCTGTGPVNDIHFWYSVAQDGDTVIDRVTAKIYTDDRTGNFSQPGDLLWEQTFDATQFTVWHNYGTGLQGFADPQQPVWQPDDHMVYHQINIVDIDNPFNQEAGTIYWLGLSSTGILFPQQPVGWKAHGCL